MCYAILRLVVPDISSVGSLVLVLYQMVVVVPDSQESSSQGHSGLSFAGYHVSQNWYFLVKSTLVLSQERVVLLHDH